MARKSPIRKATYTAVGAVDVATRTVRDAAETVIENVKDAVGQAERRGRRISGDVRVNAARAIRSGAGRAAKRTEGTKRTGGTRRAVAAKRTGAKRPAAKRTSAGATRAKARRVKVRRAS
jgi:hypothetical protein